MKRFLLFILAMILSLALVACDESETYDAGSDDNSTEVDAEETENRAEDEKKEPAEKEQQKEESFDKKIPVDNKLMFAEFTINMEQVHVYEEDDKFFVDITFKYLNQAGDGEKMFMQLSALDVEQGDSILDETTGAWDATNKNSSDIYFPNAQNGEISINLTYKLENDSDPVVITFVPLTEHDDSEKVTVEID